ACPPCRSASGSMPPAPSGLPASVCPATVGLSGLGCSACAVPDAAMAPVTERAVAATANPAAFRTRPVVIANSLLVVAYRTSRSGPTRRTGPLTKSDKKHGANSRSQITVSSLSASVSDLHRVRNEEVSVALADYCYRHSQPNDTGRHDAQGHGPDEVVRAAHCRQPRSDPGARRSREQPQRR